MKEDGFQVSYWHFPRLLIEAMQVQKVRPTLISLEMTRISGRTHISKSSFKVTSGENVSKNTPSKFIPLFSKHLSLKPPFRNLALWKIPRQDTVAGEGGQIGCIARITFAEPSRWDDFVRKKSTTSRFSRFSPFCFHMEFKTGVKHAPYKSDPVKLGVFYEFFCRFSIGVLIVSWLNQAPLSTTRMSLQKISDAKRYAQNPIEHDG